MTIPPTRTGPRLTDSQRRDWLRLIRSENVGPVAFRQLLNRFGSAAAALDALPDLARRGGGRAPRIAEARAVDAELAAARRHGARFVALGEPDYPSALAAADAPPPLLAMRGDSDVLTRRTIGVVGSRNASLAGVKMCGRLCAAFGKAGYTVASGLARGIDAAAHEASLATGTTACMAGGLDKPFPPENVPLMEAIADRGGAVISEMPFGLVPKARHFPRRNRLIAGLSLGVVVVEAATRSGTLITARLANEMGRIVFAVPGNPLDPRASGTNALLKQGATMVTDADDVVEALDPLTDPPRAKAPTLFEDGPLDASDVEPPATDRERIVAALGPTPVAVDEIVAHLGVSPGVVQTVLLELELAGRLERHRGGLVSSL